MIDTFERRYHDLKTRSVELARQTGNERLYGVAGSDGKTVGELILRSAGAVEQMIGGVTRRLWDDPFEWTLPETMQTAEAVTDYIDEVEASRKTGFLFFKDDQDLTKTLPAPVEMKTLFTVLTETLERAELLHEKAESLLASITD